MKKNILSWGCASMFAVFSPALKAQNLSPAQWESFVTTSNTTLVSDTFCLQRFENSMRDNWSYIANDVCSVIDASLSGSSLTSGGKLLRMNLGGHVFFDQVTSPLHQHIKGGINFTAKNLMKKEHLEVVLYEPNKIDTVSLIQTEKENYSIGTFHVTVNRPIFGVDFHLPSPASNTKQGFCCIDSVYLFGNIPLYSLFKGETFWNDTTAWSHLPAERHRHALIKGKMSVNSDVYCDRVDLEGHLTVEKGKKLDVQELTVHGISSVIRNEGELWLDGKLSLMRTFPEKGIWYFVSFPFDVYADGIDPAFKLKDDAPNNGGNFIYVLTYNSKSRSEDVSMNSHWEVLPEEAVRENKPIFEQNKGYLLAIDEQADRTTLRFSSRPGATPPTYGRVGVLTIDIPYSIVEEDANSGWYLCGNPLPSPLPVGKLKHPDLDGYAYVFNGESYTPLSFDENYMLPPYSAFFLKAKRSVELSLELGEPGPIEIAFSAPLPLRGKMAEPMADVPTANAIMSDHTCFQLGKFDFFINGAPANGRLTVFDAVGRELSASTFFKGEYRQIPLPKQSGFYILLIQMQNRRTEYKFIR